MFKFFRYIRMSLLDEGHLARYLTYALGEVVLVVIGILLALQLNNLNEQRIAQGISDDTRSALILEMAEVKKELDRVIDFNGAIIETTVEFFNDGMPFEEASPGEVFNLINFGLLNVDMPVLSRELGSDKLIIAGKEFSEHLRKIHVNHQRLKEIGVYLEELWNNQATPYHIKTRTMVDVWKFLRKEPFNIESARKVYQDDEFKNIAASINAFMVMYQGFLVEMRDNITSLKLEHE